MHPNNIWAASEVQTNRNANKGAIPMTKFLFIAAALSFFAPAVFATLNQAALIVA